MKQYDDVYEILVLPAFLLLVGEATMNERRRGRRRARTGGHGHGQGHGQGNGHGKEKDTP